MVWNRIALVSLLLVVPSAGQCDEGTCQSLQPYFNCQMDFGSGAAGAGNTITFANCPGIGRVAVRVRLVGDARSEKYVNAFEVLRPHLDRNVLQLPEEHLTRLPAEDRFVEVAFLSGLFSALSSRPIRPIHGKGEGHAELLWREKVRWSMAGVFDIAGPAATCTYCFNDTALVQFLPLCVRQPGDPAGQCHAHEQLQPPFELEVEVMSRAMPILQVIPEMSILELLILLTGYTMDLEKMASLSFLHDNHLGNLLVVISQTGARKITWHDLGARSYFHTATQSDFESFRKLFDESYEMVIAYLTQRSGTASLVAQLRHVKSEWSLEGIRDLDIVSKALATLAESLQQVIMQWAEGSINIRRSVLQAWSRALPPTRLEALRELLEQGARSTSSIVWVRELIRKEDGIVAAKLRVKEEGFQGEEPERAFQVSPQDHPDSRLNNVDDLATAIKQRKPVTLKDVEADQIDIYLQEAEAWKRVEGASTSLRQDTSEQDCYGFLPRKAA